MAAPLRTRSSSLAAALCAALLVSCAGGLDDIGRFAPPPADGGAVVSNEDAGSDAGEPDDAGIETDAGAPDAGGGLDAGTPDAGDDDAGVLDAGDDGDAGTPDAGDDDAGVLDDAGFDAGEPDDGGELDDAGEPEDGGTPDAGISDAGADAGGDAGSPDAGSGHDGGTPDAGTPDAGTPCNALTQIIAPTCATALCHSKGTAQAGLDLQSSGLPFRLISQPAMGGPGQIIDPDSPDQSILYLKVLKPPPFGDQMPLNAKALTAAQQQCIKSWVEAAVQ